MKRKAVLILILLLFFLGLPEGLIGGSPDRPNRGLLREPSGAGPQSELINPSGLKPVFSAEVRCPEIASPYGSQTRYDGSRRPPWQFGGAHGGIDISLAEGTSLLALAPGTIISKGEGGQLEGIYLWLSHSPEETGLGYWVYSKYQHLQLLPGLPIGAKAAPGEAIALSGKTGTVGGHYGRAGYPHLHLTTRRRVDDDQTASSGGAPGGPLIDPLVIYHEAGAKLRKPPDPALNNKSVAIPYATVDGRLVPEGTRVVWPVACRPK